jgi:DNA-directed RNA polymerase subunit RPC12/RpoP
MLLVGIYMATAEETISHCPNCGHYFKVWVKEKVSE